MPYLPDLVRVLLDAGADPCAKSSRGLTPVDYVRENLQYYTECPMTYKESRAMLDSVEIDDPIFAQVGDLLANAPAEWTRKFEEEEKLRHEAYDREQIVNISRSIGLLEAAMKQSGCA